MYEAFYNLSSGPFQLMPDPRFLFPSKGHNRALSYLLYGLQRREGFVVITGDIGIGKTLLVQKLISEIGGRNLSVQRVAMANLDADGVVPMVASAFGLEHESRSKIGLLDDLTARILPNYSRGALLIVDEAQTCTPAALEELRAISNLQAHGRALLQVFLVGQTDLRRVLAKPEMEQLRQRVITSYHLRPLDVDELREYVEHRLGAAGWLSDPELADAVYPHLHEWSQGIPRRINLIMDRLLLYGYLEELHRLDESDVRIVIDELDAEQGDEFVSEQPEETTAPISTEETHALLDRIAGIENAFTAAVGESRAKQLLDKHEASVQHKALLAMNLRIARLESLLADHAATDELQSRPRSSAQPASTHASESEASDQAPEDDPRPRQQNSHSDHTFGAASEQTHDDQGQDVQRVSPVAGPWPDPSSAPPVSGPSIGSESTVQDPESDSAHGVNNVLSNGEGKTAAQQNHDGEEERTLDNAPEPNGSPHWWGLFSGRKR